jgi:hypothetical protein
MSTVFSVFPKENEKIFMEINFSTKNADQKQLKDHLQCKMIGDIRKLKEFKLSSTMKIGDTYQQKMWKHV